MRQGLRVLERLDRLHLRIARRIAGKRLMLSIAMLDLVERLGLVMRVGYDEAAVVGAGRVELHPIELDDLRHHRSRLEKLRIRQLQVDLAVVGPAVIGRDHPGEAEVSRHQCVHRSGIDRVTPDDRRGRIGRPVPSDTVPAVDVVVAREPGAAFTGASVLPRLGRRGAAAYRPRCYEN